MKTKRRVVRLLTALAVCTVALELLYLGAASFALRRLPQWASGEDLHLSYTAAGSWLPGRAWVRNFELRGHDENIQFQLNVKEAQVQVDLLALLSRRFHATKAVTSGVEFRLRHNVHALAGNERRIAAFPPIEGYPGPPLFDEAALLEEPSSSDDDDIWTVHMEDVTAQVSQLWLLEYRYLGKGDARGSFLLEPGKTLHLEPSEFYWHGDALTVGETIAAQQLTGALHAEIHVEDLDAVPGLLFLDQVDATWQATLADGDLRFLEVYSGWSGLRRAQGRYDANVTVKAHHGSLEQDTALAVAFADATLAVSNLSARSSGRFSCAAVHRDGELHFEPVALDVKGTVFTLDGTDSSKFEGTARSNSFVWLGQNNLKALQSTVDVQVTPGHALLDPLLGELPSDIAKALVSLPRLDARIATFLSSGRSRVELLQLNAGQVSARGVWQDRPRGGDGTFALETDIADVNIHVKNGDVGWELDQ